MTKRFLIWGSFLFIGLSACSTTKEKTQNEEKERKEEENKQDKDKDKISYSLSAEVLGLKSGELILEIKGKGSASIQKEGSQLLGKDFHTGDTYEIVVLSNPQIYNCTIDKAKGIFAEQDIDRVKIDCFDQTRGDWSHCEEITTHTPSVYNILNVSSDGKGILTTRWVYQATDCDQAFGTAAFAPSAYIHTYSYTLAKSRADQWDLSMTLTKSHLEFENTFSPDTLEGCHQAYFSLVPPEAQKNPVDLLQYCPALKDAAQKPKVGATLEHSLLAIQQNTGTNGWFTRAMGIYEIPNGSDYHPGHNDITSVVLNKK